MRNNETGEFELVVGNRQLLSGFFIVVLLFAVAFAMGYVVGQNSPRSAKLAAEAASPSASGTEGPRPTPVTAVPPQQAATPADQPPADGGTAAATDNSAAAKDAEPAPAAASQAAAAAPDAPAPQLPAGSQAPDAPTGSYWQVTALAPADAIIFYEALKGKGFPTYLSPAPKGLVRVLVGPYTTHEAMGKAKTDLENAGFPHPFRR